MKMSDYIDEKIDQYQDFRWQNDITLAHVWLFSLLFAGFSLIYTVVIAGAAYLLVRYFI